jgi:hypothetical protein
MLSCMAHGMIDNGQEDTDLHSLAAAAVGDLSDLHTSRSVCVSCLIVSVGRVSYRLATT